MGIRSNKETREKRLRKGREVVKKHCEAKERRKGDKQNLTWKGNKRREAAEGKTLKKKKENTEEVAKNYSTTLNNK